MKSSFPFLALVVWISSWFPTTLDTWAILVSFFCIVGLAAAVLAKGILEDRRWPSKTILVLAFLFLLVGLFLAMLSWTVGTPVDGAITLFYAVGWVAYLLMIARVLQSERDTSLKVGLGFWVLICLAVWSWGSAFGMYFHRGANTGTDWSCILVPKLLRYDTELNSIWRMRLPEIAASRTGPTGTTILNYHAILVASSDGRTVLYNWSKFWIRFEVLDAERNPYLPKVCS